MEIIADLNIEPQTNEDNIFRNGINYEFKNRYASFSDRAIYFNYLSQEDVDKLIQILMSYDNPKSYFCFNEIKEYLKCVSNIAEINLKYTDVIVLVNDILITNEEGSLITAYLVDGKLK